ncbi:MAG: hypothetical protein U1A22_02720 [Xanthomonadaceae bacterium]|nr:hypothetical protein [Xanthomonadaceae bacterium]
MPFNVGFAIDDEPASFGDLRSAKIAMTEVAALLDFGDRPLECRAIVSVIGEDDIQGGSVVVDIAPGEGVVEASVVLRSSLN